MTHYDDRIQRVCDYIYTNLGEDLSLEMLSKVADFSKYHFHRQFSEYTGLTVHKFIQLMRLKRASYQLVFAPHEQVIDIAIDAGFENPESFSRAFKKTFGQTPSQFRTAPDWLAWHERYRFHTQAKELHMQIAITNFEAVKVAVLEHQGSPDLLNNSVAKFIEWRKASQLSPVKASNTYGIAYGDPNTTKPDFRFDICGQVKKEVPANEQGVITKEIPAGRCALIRHLGSRDQAMDEKIYYLYGQWLPPSGEELRNFPLFFHYLNLFPEVPESELVTDIYLPLK
jgi:AraC family transcriptional regulator